MGGRDVRTATIPKGRAFAFLDRCVCCNRPAIARRDLQAATSHRIQRPNGFVDVVVPFLFPEVPYCADHVAEVDAHLAKQRKELRRGEMPEPTPLADGKPAQFHAAGAKGPGGTLGFFAYVQAHVDGSFVEPGDVWVTFQDADYAEAFRHENTLMTQDEAQAYEKQRKSAKKEATPSELRRVLSPGTFRLERLRKRGDIAGLLAALDDPRHSVRANAVPKVWTLRDQPGAETVRERVSRLVGEDPHGQVRLQALRVVGSLLSTTAAGMTPVDADRAGPLDTVIAATGDPLAPVRQAAMHTLVFVPDIRALQAVGRLCDDPDPETRGEATDRLAAIGRTHEGLREAARTALVTATEHADPEVRRRAAAALATWPVS